MKRTDIITLPDKRLRQKSKKVSVVTDEIRKIAKGMEAATLDWEDHRKHEFGVALAAVQVGELVKIVVVRGDLDNKQDRSFITFINPTIVRKEGEMITDYEGCLSVLDVYGKVPRYSKVKVKALDLDGNEFRVKAEGFLARVFQHEIDHLEGKLFIDHIKDDDAFYHLDDDGKLTKIAYEEIKQSTVLW